ncbi:MAG TPA: alpha/beta hydrolase [Chitinivibrionales bacterium]|nr:alpha/beta hydrolase [Chitinivibrionales bacterium]
MNSEKIAMNYYAPTESTLVARRRKTGRKVLKFFLISAGLILLILVGMGEWIYFSVFFSRSPHDYSGAHPFKSANARAEYLAFEDGMAKTWPVHSEERLAQTSFGQTFMRVSGPADGRPLMLLPGGGCNSLIWHANIQALSQKYRTYALDNIYDYGRSVYTREMKTGADFSAWLNELFDTLRLGNNVRIAGYSYGGWVASQYALRHPERVSHVVLIAPVCTVLPLSNDYIIKMLTTLIPVRYFKSKIMYWCWADLAQMGDTGVQLVEDRIDFYQMALKCFKFKQPPNPTVLSDEELQRLKMPVLFLVGNHETVYDAKIAVDRLRRVNPKINAEMIMNTGHDLMFTHTDAVNRKVLAFLDTEPVKEIVGAPEPPKIHKQVVKRKKMRTHSN